MGQRMTASSYSNTATVSNTNSIPLNLRVSRHCNSLIRLRTVMTTVTRRQTAKITVLHIIPKGLKGRSPLTKWSVTAVRTIQAMKASAVQRLPLRLDGYPLGDIFICFTASIRKITAAASEKMKHRILTKHERQTKTAAKLTVAETTGQVSPVREEGSQEDVPHFSLHHAQD